MSILQPNRIIIALAVSLSVSACAQQTSNQEKMENKINKSETEWKAQLTDEEYYILRQKGTERAFTGEFYKHHEKGVYVCAGCKQELFSSETKYESGSGWPSFYDEIEKGNIEVKTDTSHGMMRDEVVCARCGGHLGHVFPDGPKPTGLRYCVNSASLDFKKQ